MAGLELLAAGITATAAAPGAASLAKGELKEPGRGAPELTPIGPEKTPRLQLKLEQQNSVQRKAALSMLFKNS